MKRNALINLSLVLAVILFFLADTEALAAKKKENKTQAVQVLNNDGAAKVDGSVLNPKHNELNILLNSLLSTLKKGDLANLSVVLTSIYNSTQSFTVPKDAISLQRKKLNNKNGKYLVVNLFNLQNQAGVTISPSALPTDDYKLSIVGMDSKVTTDSIKYRTPVLIVGTVNSSKAGLVTVEDLNGEKLSEKTVATNPNGTFFTEVRADSIEKVIKTRKSRNQEASIGMDAESTDTSSTTVTPIQDEVATGLVHAVTDTDLYAITPLSNDPETNASISNNPIILNEASTFTANLSKENDNLATEVAKKQLQDLNTKDTGIIEEPPSGIGCDLNIFADRCKDTTPETFLSIGSDFKNFLQTATCNFPEFGLIKSIILTTPDNALNFVGKGYCEHTGRQVDDQKPCEIYSKILANFKTGLSKDLPCPPPDCTEFAGNTEITSKCINPVGFCQARFNGQASFSLAQICRGPNCAPPQGQGPNSCFQKPTKDLYCAKIGIDIDASECTNNNFNGPSQFNPGWIIVTNSKGNKYCVPSNIPIPPTQSGGFQLPSTPESVAEECELNACHNQCSIKFGFNHGPISPGSIYPGSPLEAASQGLSNCHFACDADAGRIFDCGNPLSKYFSIKCCSQSSPGFVSGFPGESFGPQVSFSSRPVPIDIRGCLCGDTNNFNNKGYVKEDAQNTCRNKCPQGFEKDQYSDSCLPACPEEATRDPGGSCRKKCPEGFTQDEFGNCRCPQGQKYDPFSHKCISGQCPPDQYLDPNGACRCISDSSIPPPNGFCSQQGKICQPGEVYNPNTNPCRCTIGASYGPGNICQCPSGQPYTANGCGYSSNYCPPPYITNPSNNPPCKCPESIPISFSSTCVAKCPEGLTAGYPPTYGGGAPGSNYTPILACLCPDKSSYPDQSGKCYGSGQRYCGAGEIPTASNPCTCGPGGSFGIGNTCQCTNNNNPPYTPAGCGTTNVRVCVGSEVPTATNSCTCAFGATVGSNGQCQCTNGKPYTGLTTCNTQTTNYCVAGTGPSSNPSNPCSCAPPGTPNGPNATCQCPPGSSIAYSAQGCGTSTTSHVCATGEPATTANPCYCAGGATFTGPGGTGTCQCTNGIAYTATGCGTTTTNYCSPGILVGTSSCTCNPSGGAYNSNGYCTCPSGSSSPYTKEYGCGSSTTTNCPSPYVTNPSGNPPCKCPDATPITYNTTCVATCPQGLIASYPTTSAGSGYSAALSCLCQDKSWPNSNGQCSTSTTNYCSPGILVGTSSCTCNPSGGAYNLNGYCTCPSGSSTAYTVATGCVTTTTHTCALGEVSNASNPCTCASGATVGSNSQCQCTNGQVYASGGCPGTTSTRTCAASEANTASNPCTCAGTATFGTGNTCTCSSGKTYSATGCWRTCSQGENPILGACVCAAVTGTLTGKSNGLCDCPTGQTYTINGCVRSCAVGEATSPTNPCACAGLGSAFITPTGPGSICQCLDGGQYTAAPSGGSYIQAGCTPPSTITLNSVTISGSNVTISFSVDPNTCLLVKDTNNNSLKSGNLCGVGSFNSVFPTSDFTPSLVSGTQVKLCNQNNSSNCSALVAVTGK